MIDFRYRTTDAASSSLLERLQRSGMSMTEMVTVLAKYIDERTLDQANVVPDLCLWPSATLSQFLNAAYESRQPGPLTLAEGVLRQRGISGLLGWIESLLAQSRGRRWLVDLLPDIHEPDSTRLLLSLLDHPQQSIRRRAADGLASHRGSLDLRGFVRFLSLPLIQGTEQPPPLRAVRALHRLADPALEPNFGKDAAQRAERVLINSVRHERRATVRGDAIAALGEIGSRRAVRCLVDMLHREDEVHHRDVVIALRKIHPDRALIALLGLLQSPDPIIREEAANALGEIGDPAAVRRLRDLMTDENPDVRQEAVLALGKLGGPEVLNALEEALADRDASVRAMACNALAESLGSEAQGKLIGALYDGSADVRAEAAFHLGNLGDQQAEPHLEAFSSDGHRDAFGESVGQTARRSLNRLRFLKRYRSKDD